MATARNGDVEIAYETFGATDGTPLLLLTGAGAQMVMWPVDFCAALVARGFQVVRMDNRDVGLSTHLTQYDVPRPRGQLAYTLRDMTDDVIAVFDALGWSSGHLFGWSMGGMIAQATAIHHSSRVRSLTSLGSTPALRPWFGPKISALVKTFRVMSKDPADRDAEGQRWVDLYGVVGSTAYPRDEDHWREAGRLAFDHGRNPNGDRRHFAAVRAAGDRRRALARLQIPALVLHGERDPLALPRAGRATAAAIPGARFVSYPGMGHDLPRELWPAIIDEVSSITSGAHETSAQTGKNSDN
jgi:pimeloyl-ACP methyl ester carboxylesterase